MKFKHRLQFQHELAPINFVPLLNLIFLILIFFLLSTTFSFQTGISVKLPKAVTSDLIKEENSIIVISSEDIIYLNGAVRTIRELEKELNKSDNPNRSVLIKADRRSSMGRIVDVWNLCRKIGIERINLATNQTR